MNRDVVITMRTDGSAKLPCPISTKALCASPDEKQALKRSFAAGGHLTPEFERGDSVVEGGMIAIAAVFVSPIGWLLLATLGGWTTTAAKALF